jgi:cysteine desulfurase
MKQIYLDYNASTPIAPAVAAAMAHAMTEGFGNPSSVHWAGTPARNAVETARRQVADLLGCAPEEVVFTSGGSEANNMALKGVFFASKRQRRHIVTTRVEHPAIVAPCRFLERLGAEVTWLPVDGTGLVDPDDLRRAITPDTILVSIMHANNEVGTIQPIADCAAITRERGIPFHSDAAQSVGKIPTRVGELGVDLLTIAGHKLYAPKGIGALYVRQGLPLEPLVHGAGHEGGRRAGTESAILTAALAAACVLARDLAPMEGVQALRDRFWSALEQRFGTDVALNGHPKRRLPNTLNVSFVGRVGAEILAGLDGVAASTGSACHAGRVELSPVLEAMGISPEVGMGALRFSLGRETTAGEIDDVIHRLAGARRQTRESELNSQGLTWTVRPGSHSTAGSMSKRNTLLRWLAPLATVLSLAACYGTLAAIALLGLLGARIVLDDALWAGAIVAFALVAVAGLTLGARRHRTFWPLAVGAIGAAAVVYAMIVSYDRLIEIGGFILLTLAAAADWRISRSYADQPLHEQEPS